MPGLSKQHLVRSLACTLVIGSLVVMGAPELTSITAASPQKVMREYKGVRLGMKSEEVQAALGKPENKSEASEEYKLSGDDTLTVHYDSGLVKALMFYYSDAKNAPTWKDVVGDAEVKVNENGSKFAKVEVSAEKFWVLMYQNKTGTTTTITISR